MQDNQEILGDRAFVACDKAHCLFKPSANAAVSVIPPYGTEVEVIEDAQSWVLIKFCGKKAWSPRANLSAEPVSKRAAVDAGVVPEPYSGSPSSMRSYGSGAVEYGPRGGRFVRTASGFRRYF